MRFGNPNRDQCRLLEGQEAISRLANQSWPLCNSKFFVSRGKKRITGFLKYGYLVLAIWLSQSGYLVIQSGYLVLTVCYLVLQSGYLVLQSGYLVLTVRLSGQSSRRPLKVVDSAKKLSLGLFQNLKHINYRDHSE